jgi:hypothetical protein
MDAVLVANLRKAKSSKCHFAMIVKGSGGKLLVAGKKIAAKDIAEAKKEAGGGTAVSGTCFGDDGGLIFETDGPPAATWKKTASAIIKADAGMTVKVEFRQKGDTGAEEGAEAEGED